MSNTIKHKDCRYYNNEDKCCIPYEWNCKAEDVDSECIIATPITD